MRRAAVVLGFALLASAAVHLRAAPSAGEPLAYSEMEDSGKTRLFIASNCYPD